MKKTLNVPLKEEAYKYLLGIQGKMKQKKANGHFTLPETVEWVILDHKSSADSGNNETGSLIKEVQIL